MSMKKFKDLSSFGFTFTSRAGEKATVTVLNGNINSNIDTSEVATNISVGTSDSILVSSINNHLSPNKQSEATLPEATSSLDSMKLKNDIGNYIHNRLNLSNELRYLLLTQHFVPDEKFKWPFVQRKTNNTIENRFLRPNHLNDNKPWLVYSPSKSGLFCVPCVLFTKAAGNNHLGSFVLSPCQQYGKLLGADGQITRHKLKNYHNDSILDAERFISVYENKCDSVDDLLVNKQKQEKIENRKRLVPIIKTIILCGQNNIPLRGHRDDGNLNVDSIVSGEGNFRSLLRYRIDAGDSMLANHLSTASKTATYISKTTQNELIEICGDLIREQILAEVKHATFFTVIGDETTDVNTIEQFTFCLRYVFENKVHEKFISFLPAEDRTGEGLARLILEEIKNLGLNPNFMVGQAYDGCSAMSGKFNGCHAYIQKLFPTALYLQCASHSLNLAISDSCFIIIIQNCIGSIKEIYNYFNSSSKRTLYLKQIINNSNKKKLASVCDTRWVERHDAVITFRQLYPFIMTCFEKIIEEETGKNQTLAFNYLKNIQSSCFIISLCILKKCLSMTLPIAAGLQAPDNDIMDCKRLVDDVLFMFKQMRNEKLNEEYGEILSEVKQLCELSGTQLTVMRGVGRQMYRPNAPAQTPEEYYRVNLFIPIMDHFIVSLTN
ncbi:unnamed protein product [Rotaria sp. Silwood2]|nr:unnamed protein product [Rotaria sp. Silwood2]